MKFTKEPPYELGQLSCVINATIEIKNLNVPKIKSASAAEANNALISIGYGYESTYDLGHQWIQMADILDKMELTKDERNKILILAEHKLEVLKSSSKLS